MVKWYIMVTCVALTVADSLGQQDTTMQAPMVTISAEAHRSAMAGSSSVTVSTSGEESVTEALEQEANLFFKQYGPGSLATPSMRGGSASHTLVLWQGIPLHSPTLGLLDFSLLAAGPSQDVTVVRGGSTALWGSGAVSGLISLESQYDDTYRLRSASSIGSFGLLKQSLTGNIGTESLNISTTYQHESGDRDWPIRLGPNIPQRIQDNAAYSRNHLMQDIRYQFSSGQQIEAHWWLHKSSTQLPPTTVQTSSEAYQEDAAARAMVGWSHTGGSSKVAAKVSYIHDENDYYDPQQQIESQNTYRQWLTDVTAQYYRGKYAWMVGTTLAQTTAETGGYIDGVTESRVALFASQRYEHARWQAQLSARLETVDGELLPVVPAAGLSYKLVPSMTLRTKVSRDYRLPTLNDRYWSPGGNADLLPESGWSCEAGTDVAGAYKQWSYNYSVTGYHRNLTNWILWTPSIGSPTWSAFNINQVLSQGLEQQASVQMKRTEWTVRLSGQYDFVKSTFQQALALPRVEKGDQLVYTPRHQGQVKIEAQYRDLGLSVQQRLVGSSRGVNDDLASYRVTDLTLAYGIVLHKYHMRLELVGHNIGDSQYSIIERRPLPGRNYSARVLIDIE